MEQSKGFRGYRVVAKTQESAVITSFGLQPVEQGAAAVFIPGQFLTLRLADHEGVSVIRNYSLSGDPGNTSQWRISVKRESAPVDRPDLPHGYASGFLHEQTQVGDVLQLAGPMGAFTLDQNSTRPVLLFSGGVGLTPMVSMLHWLSHNTAQPVYFIHACENGSVHAMRDEVLELANRRPGIDVHFCYRNPSDQDLERGACHSQGLIGRQTLQALLPLDDYEVYLCGPPQFMQVNWRLLRELGISAERIHYEFFGPATVLRDEQQHLSQPTVAEPATPLHVDDSAAQASTVKFLPSGISIAWNPDCHSLLDLAEQVGLAPVFNCRAGICGTCQVGLRQGQVKYFEEPLEPPAQGAMLLCCSRPLGSVVVDLG